MKKSKDTVTMMADGKSVTVKSEKFDAIANSEASLADAKKGASKEKKLPLFQRVELTEEEVRDAADRMADLFDQLKRIEEEAKSIANGYKAKTKELDAQFAQAQLLVRNKYEQRLVECVRTWNYKTCRVVTVRTDTGAIVEDRAMSADERQEKLFPEENP
jgi:hypothetical protein